MKAANHRSSFGAKISVLHLGTPSRVGLPPVGGTGLKLVILASFAFALVLLTACGAATPRDSQPTSAHVLAGGISRCTPARIAVLPDQTASTLRTRTPQLKPLQLQPLINLIIACGGELSVSAIRDRQDNASMLRLRIATEPLQAPVAPRQDLNAFQLNLDENRFDREEEAYNQRLAQRKAEISQRVEDFQAGLEELLARRLAARASAVCDGFRHADLFLSEPGDSWWANQKSYVVAVTDGQDTYSKRPCTPLRSGSPVLLVNGSGSVGSLSTVSPLRFESFEAAVDYILGKEKK